MNRDTGEGRSYQTFEAQILYELRRVLLFHPGPAGKLVTHTCVRRKDGRESIRELGAVLHVSK